MNEDVLELIVRWKKRHPADSVPKELDVLFDRLQSPTAERDAFEIEDAIWEMRTAHRNAPIIRCDIDILWILGLRSWAAGSMSSLGFRN